MSIARFSSAAIVSTLLLLGCTDTAVQTHNALPEVGITSHSNGNAVAEGVEFLLRGIVSDADNEQSELVATWFSSVDTVCEGIAVSDNGVTECLLTLPEGETRITLQVTDPDGGSGAANVDLVVTSADTPLVAISSPQKGETYYADHIVLFEGTVSVTEGLEDPNVWWESSLDGDLSIVLEETEEVYVGQGMLSVGAHELTLFAESAGKIGSATVLVDVATTSTPPLCQIDTPSEGTVTELGAPVLFTGTVSDVDLPAEQLAVVWTSDLEGVLSEDSAATDGTLSFTAKLLSSGLHVVTLSVTDEVGETCTTTTSTTTTSTTVSSAPVVVISGPVDGTVLNPADVLTALATVSDEDQTADSLVLEWWSDIDGVLSTDGANASGLALLSYDALSVGTHTVTLAATDDAGLVGDDSIVIRINSLPSAPMVSISPTPATTGDDLTVNIDTDGVDTDGDPVTYTVAWYRDGKHLSSETSMTLSSTLTSSAESWEAYVTSNDGIGVGGVGTASVVIENSVPTVADVVVSPNPAMVGDTLTCTYGFDDQDGDSDLSSADWTVNGVWIQTGGALSSGFYVGDTVSCVVTPFDGVAFGVSVSDSIVIDNQAPVLSSVELSPDPAYEMDTLTCISGSVTDEDGDIVFTFTTSWMVNGASIAHTGTTIDGADFSRDDTVSCTMVPNDGVVDGLAVSSNEVMISNTAPTMGSVTMSPANPYAGDELSCTSNWFSDADGDADQSTVVWSVNGVVTATTDTLSSGFVYGDNVTCEMTAFDGYDVGTVGSASLTILNTAPTLLSVAVSPDPAFDELLTCVAGAVDEPDGQALTYTGRWYVNGVTSSGGETLSSFYIEKGDTVYCEMRANDGVSSGDFLASPSVVIQNSPPDLTSTWITPSSPSPSDTLTCNTTGFSDTDGDADQTVFSWDVNGVVVGSSSTLSGLFGVNDEVTCTATAYDGEDYGTEMTATVTVENTLPTVMGVDIDPKPAKTNDVLAVTGTTSDDDGDTVTLVYSWKVDGVEVSTDPTLDGAIHFDKGQSVEVTVTPFDGFEYGTPKTDDVVVQNSLAEGLTVLVNPQTAYGGLDDLICAVETTPIDADGDALTYSVWWKKDDSAWGGVPETTHWEDDTVTADRTSEGDAWKCIMTPNDGEDDGYSSNNEVTILDPCLVSICDTAATGDTGPVGFYDGTWDGIFFGEFWVTALGLTDTCDVPLDVIIEQGAAPELRGSTSCTLNYTFFGVDFTDTKGITFSANITADPVLEGEVMVDSAVEPWFGSFTDDDTLYGEFSGSTKVYGYKVEYIGDVSATR